MNKINLSLVKLVKRAEDYDPEQIVQSFVSIDALSAQLNLPENQILFGRRGTGKTHIFSFLQNQLKTKNNITISIDMRQIGSSGGIYADANKEITDRATRLLVDTLRAIHDSIHNQAIDNAEEWNLSNLSPILDEFYEATTEVIAINDIKETISYSDSEKKSNTANAKLSCSLKDMGIGFNYGNSSENDLISSKNLSYTKTPLLKINFGSVNQKFKRIVQNLPSQKIWIFLDEWSEVPLDLQPYLADLLKRTLFPITGVTFKIAAIEQRSRFRISTTHGNIGIEIGADASASLNLDEFLIFDNNKDLAKEFFKNLIYQHVKALPQEELGFNLPDNSTNFANLIFTQTHTLEEFVRASEGVPRDAINIINIAAQKANEDKISVPIIRDSARIWFSRSKQQAISSNSNAVKLLTWIIDEVIKHRKARGFLLEVSAKDKLIDFLYDERVLHIVKQSVSSNDAPGKRFNVYNIDYGCYVELINTVNAPRDIFGQGELELDENNDIKDENLSVPLTDYRSIRGAILDLTKFKKETNSQ